MVLTALTHKLGCPEFDSLPASHAGKEGFLASLLPVGGSKPINMVLRSLL